MDQEKYQRLKEELREAEKEVHQAVWPNINDAKDFQHVRDLKKQIRDLLLEKEVKPFSSLKTLLKDKQQIP